MRVRKDENLDEKTRDTHPDLEPQQQIMAKTPKLTSEDAEAIALQALGFLASDGARLMALLEATGSTPSDLRRMAETPGTLQAILDHITRDESLLLVFASEAGLDPTRVTEAALLLEHGDKGLRR